MSPSFQRLSAPGASALSCWRMEADAGELQRLFGVIPSAVPRRVKVGPTGGIFDEALLLYLRSAPGSAELHLHGGGGTAQALRSWLNAEGWRERTPESASTTSTAPLDAEAARRRFLHADAPLSARAWSCFAAAGGAEGVLRTLAQRTQAARADAAQRLLQWEEWARLLEEPPLLVLAGPPNAGKSSLFNAWLGSARATVADAPGTTRDAVGENVRFGTGAEAWTARLCDSAGLWEQAGGVDQAAVARSEGQLRAAWRRLWIFDAATAPDPRAVRALRWAHPEDLRLLHRTDLGETWSPEQSLGGSWLRGSLREDGGGLTARLEAELLAPLGPPPPVGALLPFGAALRERLRAAAQVGNG
ncbi:MAG: 50S ribosome-binding GTPase [Planctomycetota bacterium]|nr:50S ribosome-binding GTPase [Planctomycetota bacterium]